jgi:hypothetical protein
LTRSWSAPSGAMVIISVACFASACREVNIGVSSWWCPVGLVNRCRWLAASSSRPGCAASCADAPVCSAPVQRQGAAAVHQAGWACAAFGGRPPGQPCPACPAAGAPLPSAHPGYDGDAARQIAHQFNRQLSRFGARAGQGAEGDAHGGGAGGDEERFHAGLQSAAQRALSSLYWRRL